MRPPILRHRAAAAVALLCCAAAGCGASPSLSDVRANMRPEQLAVAEPMVDSAGIVLVPVPTGQFAMGTPQEQADAADPNAARVRKEMKSGDRKRKTPAGPESPQHLVRITRPFFMGATEITQAQFKAVTGREPWAGKPLVELGDGYPASHISWDDAAEFCRVLSEREDAVYRLPTEAEWEYVCRAGTDGFFSFDDPKETFADHVWFMGNTYKVGEQYPHAVAGKRPNPWALYDMHGNVWEWCGDWYGPYTADNPKLPVDDPAGPEGGWIRVWRGGGFASEWPDTRSAARVSGGRVAYREPAMSGFRVVREIEP